MHKTSFYFLLIVVLLFSASSCESAQLAGAKGKVIDGYGNPVAGAEIIATTDTNIENELRYKKITTKTGKDGSFLIKGLSDRFYKIYPSKKNYYSTDGTNPRQAHIPTKSNLIIEEPLILYSYPSWFDYSSRTVKDKDTGLTWSREIFLAKCDDVSKFIDDMNSSNYAGYNNWRLPTSNELNELCNKASNYRNSMRHKTHGMRYATPKTIYEWTLFINKIRFGSFAISDSPNIGDRKYSFPAREYESCTDKCVDDNGRRNLCDKGWDLTIWPVNSK